MKKLGMIVTGVLLGLGLRAQSPDTTFIMVFGGVNAEEAVEVITLDSVTALIVANTGSFGAGGSDIYYSRVNAQAEIVESWLWGGVNQDQALDALVLDSVIFTLGFRNTFDVPEYQFFIRSSTLDGEPLGLTELGDYDPSMNLVMAVWDSKVRLLRIDGDELKLFTVAQDATLEQDHTWNWNAPDQLVEMADCGGPFYFSTIRGEEGSRSVCIHRIDTNGAWDIVTHCEGDFHDLDDAAIAVGDSTGPFMAFNYLEHPDSVWNISVRGFNDSLDTLWASDIVQADNDFVRDLTINAFGNLAFCGRYNSFGEAGDFFIARYSTAGTFLDVRTLGSAKLDQGIALSQNGNSGGYWLFGNTEGFGSSSTDLLLYHTNSSGVTYSNAFLRVNEDLPVITSSSSPLNHSSLSIYPNPVKSGSDVFFNADIKWKELTLVDPSGRVVFEAQEVKSFPTKSLSPGLYFLHARDNESVGQPAIPLMIIE